MLGIYTRITNKERIEIEKLLSHNKSFTEIGLQLNRHKSSISREVKRWGREDYKSIEAQLESALQSSQRRHNKTKLNECSDLKKYVLGGLAKRWSPGLISAMLSRKFGGRKEMQLSAETIYVHIYDYNGTEQRKLLIGQLFQQRKFRGNIRRGADSRTTIKGKISIDARPSEVATRMKAGDWEGDLILGKEGKSAIGTLVERSSRILRLVPLKGKDALTVRKGFEKTFKAIPRQMKRSLTYDNGTEMAQHALFTQHTKMDVYFAHTYSPWERGTNENTNGLLRSYFPKGTDLSLVSKKRLQEVEDELNDRPRRVLNYQTPNEVFAKFAQANN